MTKLGLRKGDKVKVISGKDRGKTGNVLRVLPRENRVIVEKANFIKRHSRPTDKNPSGGIVEREGAIHVSNVMLVCSSCGDPTRVAKRKTSEGKSIRVCRRCDTDIDKA